MTRAVPALFYLVLAGCTSIEVTKPDPSHQLYHVCIEENPKVIVRGFLPTVRDGFARHGLSTEVYQGNIPTHCEYHLTYTALQNWDMATYMHHAELRLYKGYDRIAYAEYHLTGKGGFALNKWASVEAKMDPVIDQLLSDYSSETVTAYRQAIPFEPASKFEQDAQADGSAKTKELRRLKEWYEEGLITQEEYDKQRKEALAQ